MLEIDLPRMQSLSPQFDSSPLDSIPGMTNFNLSDITETPEPDPSSSSLEVTKTCDWKYESEMCGCKTSCGCKYINKVRFICKIFQSCRFSVLECWTDAPPYSRTQIVICEKEKMREWVLCSEQCHHKPIEQNTSTTFLDAIILLFATKCHTSGHFPLWS